MNGVHLVEFHGKAVPAHETEYADDPVFGLNTGALVDYVAEKSERAAVNVTLQQLRAGELVA